MDAWPLIPGGGGCSGDGPAVFRPSEQRTDGWSDFPARERPGARRGLCAAQLADPSCAASERTVDRTAFLERLPRAHPGRSPGLLVPDLPKVDLISHFTGRLASVDGVVHGPFPPAAVADLVTTILREHEATEYLGWDDVGVAGLHQRLTMAGLGRVEGHLPDRGWGRVRHLAGYQDLVAGLTGADAGLAESGSIVVRSGPGRPRMASLIPLVHVAILSTHRLYRSLCHYVADHPAAIEGTSNLVIITGPSRTGDIEQQLNLGVHGPKHLHVILVD